MFTYAKVKQLVQQAQNGSLSDLGSLLRDLVDAVHGTPINVTAATVTITQGAHGNRTITFDRAAGITATLPAASGSGMKIRVTVKTTLTSNGIIQVANASDVIQGGVLVATDTGGITVPTAATSDTITMNGSTTGGIKGSHLELEDVAANLWRVSGFLISTGAEATPFSAAVS